MLARDGYGANALGLSRSLIETWITIRWLTNKETETRVRRFRDFNSKLRERIIQLIGEYYPGFDLDGYVGNKHHDLKAMEYSRWDTWGPGVKAMAKEEEVLQDELVGANSPAFAYDVAFFASSYYLHPTPLGLQHHFLNPGEIFSFQARSDEKDVAEQALNFTAHTIALCAFRVGLFWKNETQDALIDLWDQWNNHVSRC